MKALQIESPCSEEWTKMVPNQQGAFCNSCQKNVIDFTRKTKTEIVSFFKENIGKSICGRFGKHQLDQINADYSEWENQHIEIFRSKFVLALLLVFGLSLFSCKGPEQFFQDPLSETESGYQNTIPEISDQTLSDMEETNTDVSIPDTLTVRNLIIPDFKLPPPEQITFNPETILVTTLGAIWVDEEWIRLYEDPKHDGSIHENSLTLDFKLPMNELETMLSPATFEIESFPASASAKNETLILTNYKEGYVNITLRDSKSKELQKIQDGNLAEGRHLFEINFTHCLPGVYFICVQHGNEEKILPVQLMNSTS